ncbi:MAG TPA: M23 family metallopeptidase [Chloroflexia bacterium]|nr:M23 family metallopeptidase [Chloroflexia bacterium]
MALTRSVAVAVFLLSTLISTVAWQGEVKGVSAAAQPTASQPAPAVKPAANTYFPETGHYLTGVFRDYWLKNGALPQFGYPLTEEFKETNPQDGKVYTVQYFERARFEYHPEFAGTVYNVELGHLGRQFSQGGPFAESPAFSSTPQRFYFPQTRHSLSYGFKTYWEAHGGLAIYGYPISEEIQESGYTVQYFERARFEYHPEFKGTPYEVLLGLLGTWALENNGYQPSQTYRVQPDPAAIIQGRTAQITVTGTGARAVSATFDGTPLVFNQLSPEKYVALAPVASNAPLRSRVLKTEITDNTGVVRRFEQNIAVLAGSFEHQTIALDSTVEAGLGTPEEQQRERDRDFSFYRQVTPEKLWNGKFSWPAVGTITTHFGARRDYVDGGSEIHDGIDIALAYGTPIRAPQRGRVVLAEFQKVRGNIVIIDHGYGLHTAYFHQSKINVKVGDMLNQGDIIGYAGTTGLSTGTHLHWEMRIGEVGVNPEEWVNRAFF